MLFTQKKQVLNYRLIDIYILSLLVVDSKKQYPTSCNGLKSPYELW